MNIADSYGYPAAAHINVIVAEHKASGGNTYPVSGDHTTRARIAAAKLPEPVEKRPTGCGCTFQRGRHSRHCELRYELG